MSHPAHTDTDNSDGELEGLYMDPDDMVRMLTDFLGWLRDENLGYLCLLKSGPLTEVATETDHLQLARDFIGSDDPADIDAVDE